MEQSQRGRARVQISRPSSGDQGIWRSGDLAVWRQVKSRCSGWDESSHIYIIVDSMKVRSAIKKLCPHCYIVQRGKRRYVYCKETPKHKQRQGFHTIVNQEQAWQFPTMDYCFFAAPQPKINFSFSESILPTGVKENPLLKYNPNIGINSVLFGV
jgi:ribosomal protein L36